MVGVWALGEQEVNGLPGFGIAKEAKPLSGFFTEEVDGLKDAAYHLPVSFVIGDDVNMKQFRITSLLEVVEPFAVRPISKSVRGGAKPLRGTPKAQHRKPQLSPFRVVH